MPAYEFVTVDVFTDRRFGGNPLAVFPEARGLSDADMQALATEFNLSETSFILPPDNPQHTARVRIFTPRTELPFAGHPNVGTGYVLARRLQHRPEHFTFEEGSGLVRVRIERGPDGQPSGARIAAPHSLRIGIDVPPDLPASCGGLAMADIATEAHHPLVAGVGVDFLIAEVADPTILTSAACDPVAFRQAAQRVPELGSFALCLYARQDGDATRLRIRVFAPFHGTMEDPATGSAAAALAALLTSLAPGDNVDLAYDIEQGEEMGRPSRLFATGRKEAEGPVTATVAGSCVPVMTGSVGL